MHALLHLAFVGMIKRQNLFIYQQQWLHRGNMCNPRAQLVLMSKTAHSTDGHPGGGAIGESSVSSLTLECIWRLSGLTFPCSLLPIILCICLIVGHLGRSKHKFR